MQEKAKKTLREHLKQDGQEKIRNPLDPSRGLILSQGSLLQHFAFALIGFYITKYVEPTIKNKSCIETSGVNCTHLNTNPENQFAFVDGFPSETPLIFQDMLIDSSVTECIDGECSETAAPYLVVQPAEEDDKVLECIDKDTNQIIYTKDHIPHAVPKLYMMHGACFVAQLIALIWKQMAKRSHLHNALTLLTVPMY